jgi:hypothetical protein
MGMSQQSSKETRKRAKDLSEAIGSYHVNLDIDEVYHAQRNLVVNTLDFEPKFKTEGGTPTENLMLQNIQARTRMVTGNYPSKTALFRLQLADQESFQHTSLLRYYPQSVGALAVVDCWSWAVPTWGRVYADI